MICFSVLNPSSLVLKVCVYFKRFDSRETRTSDGKNIEFALRFPFHIHSGSGACESACMHAAVSHDNLLY